MRSAGDLTFKEAWAERAELAKGPGKNRRTARYLELTTHINKWSFSHVLSAGKPNESSGRRVMDDDLPKRAIACLHWRWMPGMHIDGMGVVLRPCLVVVVQGIVQEWGSAPVYPDLTNPATLGCLLALVRDAHGDPGLTTSFYRDGWAVDCSIGLGRFKTEAEALVAALEAADGREVSDDER